MSAKTMASSGKWTIPSDPGERLQRGGMDAPRALARVKPEAAVIAKASVGGSIGLVLQQYPPVVKRPQSDQQTRDHQRDNVVRMRKIQEAFKAKQREKQEEREQQQQRYTGNTGGAVAAVRGKPMRAVHPQHEDIKPKVDTNIHHQSQKRRPHTAAAVASIARPPSCQSCGQDLPSRQQRWSPVEVPELAISSASSAEDRGRHHSREPPRARADAPKPGPSAGAVLRGRPRSASLDRRPTTVGVDGRSVAARSSTAGAGQRRPQTAAQPAPRPSTSSGYAYAEPKAPRGTGGHGRRSSRNFVTENVQRMADKPRMQRSSSLDQLAIKGTRKRVPDETYQKGQLPQYLVKRQEQWRQEDRDRIARRPDPNCPPGHVVMPTEDRLTTLHQLEDNHGKLSKELQSLPVRSDTMRVKNRKTELERTLGEIEDALKIFSRPKVYVKQDS